MFDAPSCCLSGAYKLLCIHSNWYKFGCKGTWVGTGWANSCPGCMNRLRKHYSQHFASGWISYEAKIEENEMVANCWESNPGYLWLEPPVLCHWAMTTSSPWTLTILYMYCTNGAEYLSHTSDSHSVCAMRTLLGVDWKILYIRKEPMLNGFLTLGAQNILPHTGLVVVWLSWLSGSSGGSRTLSLLLGGLR